MADSQSSLNASSGRLAPLVHGNDPWCGSNWDEADQDQAGPTYIVIGPGVPDNKLQKIAQRYGYSVEQLRAFRDDQNL